MELIFGYLVILDQTNNFHEGTVSILATEHGVLAPITWLSSFLRKWRLGWSFKHLERSHRWIFLKFGYVYRYWAGEQLSRRKYFYLSKGSWSFEAPNMTVGFSADVKAVLVFRTSGKNEPLVRSGLLICYGKEDKEQLE